MIHRMKYEAREFDAVKIVFIDLHHFEFDHRRMKKATSTVGWCY